MTTEQQNTNWACLPKEAREKIKEYYTVEYDSIEIAAELATIFDTLFGHDNIYSEAEPEEMLMVERKEVQEIYHQIKLELGDGGCSEYQDDINMEKESMLKSLFGDKCLPDKELNEDNFAKSEPSVQDEPKFEVGQQVKIVKCTHPEYIDKVGIITSIDTCGNPFVKVEGLGSLKHAPYALEPYTEPETKDNMEEKAKEYAFETFCGNAAMLLELPWPDFLNTYAAAYLVGATEALASQWRSVEDELPQEDAHVLCRMKDSGEIVSGYITKRPHGYPEVATNSHFHFEDYGGYECTHWMPIPEAPKTDTK